MYTRKPNRISFQIPVHFLFHGSAKRFIKEKRCAIENKGKCGQYANTPAKRPGIQYSFSQSLFFHALRHESLPAVSTTVPMFCLKRYSATKTFQRTPAKMPCAVKMAAKTKNPSTQDEVRRFNVDWCARRDSISRPPGSKPGTL